MNSKTARLIRRYAAEEKRPYRATKRAWNMVPRNKRHMFKLEMQAKIGEVE